MLAASPDPGLLVAVPARRDDLRHCRRVLSRASRTFSLASNLLPPSARRPTRAFYAFCRVADDMVDESPSPARAIGRLRAMLDRVYAGQPADDPVERELGWLVHAHDLPRPVFDALLEGFEWDVDRRRYATIEDLLAYCARVASTVGVVMSAILGRRERHVLARATELGLALQLVNISRDVGEDLARGRVYLPLQWLAEAGVNPDELLRTRRYTPAVGEVVSRTLDAARGHAEASWAGIAALPARTRPAVRAAATLYMAIGEAIEDNRMDSISTRAHVSGPRKVALLASSLLRPGRGEGLHAPAPASTRFLVEAVTR